ncbi:MAG: peptide deformylase [Bacteroidales bacterium]|nr:peptide deformylase [Bacteroidales bacterium]MBN2632386.1 peptide deformylase [Bacteroidales bacterium]
MSYQIVTGHQASEMAVPIILYGSSVLRKNSDVITGGDNITRIAAMLTATLKRAQGIGLAAPQINILKRIFAIDTSALAAEDRSIENFEGIFINPSIIEYNSRPLVYREGCLSIPEIFEEVTRPEKIVVRYQDQNLGTHETEMDGIKARVFQHELDHLNGILFIDKINILKRKLLTSRLNRIKKLSAGLNNPA